MAQQDIGPIHEHLKLHPIDGGTRVRCEGKEFFLTWTDSGSMWAHSIEEKRSDDGNSFQVVVQIGTYSQSSQVVGIQTYNITTSVFAPAAVIALIVAGAVAGVIAIGLAVSAAAIATAAETAAGALGYTATFGVPVGAVTGLVFAVVFAIVFIGLVYLLDWLNRKYTIRLQIQNWDKDNDWELDGAYYNNAVVAGDKEQKFEPITIPKVIDGPILPPGFLPVEPVDTVRYYAAIVWENDNRFLKGCSMALRLRKKGTDQGCSVDLLIQLSGFFDVSLDLLVLGKENAVSGESKRKLLKSDLTEFIKRLEVFKESL